MYEVLQYVAQDGIDDETYREIDSVQESSNAPAWTLLHNWAYIYGGLFRSAEVLTTSTSRSLLFLPEPPNLRERS